MSLESQLIGFRLIVLWEVKCELVAIVLQDDEAIG